jgi:hypothetical protein
VGGPEGNFRAIAVLPVVVSRLLVILTLLAAALPAAASAQTPPAGPPVAVTGLADTVTETAANLNGTVDPNGLVTTYHFEYGTSAAYGLSTPEDTAPEGTDPVAVKAAIANLTRNTTYNYRLVATNAAGISRGANRTFRTDTGPLAPTVSSTTSREVSSRTARLLTRVDPNGQATTVRFEYGRSTSFGAFTDSVSVGSGTSAVPVSLPVEGLRPNTRYYFRAVATNETGSTRSSNRTFRTTREPTGVSIALNPSRVVWGGALTVVGRINGTAVGGIRVALERQSFPFQSGFTEVASKTASNAGTFSFNVASLFETTQYRIVTRTRTPISSGIRTASSALRVGIRSRRFGRRKARITGAIWPNVPTGRASLQKRSPRGRWAVVKRAAVTPLDANRSRYRFTVRKPKRKRPAARYRVVVLARDGGAHVPGQSREVRVPPVRRR